MIELIQIAEDRLENGIPNWRIVSVDLPDGWHRVWRGAVRGEDKYLNNVKINHGEVSFEPIKCPEFPYTLAETYTMLIRSDKFGSSVDKPCEHCRLEYAETGMRFCERCISKGNHRLASTARNL